MAGSVSVSQPNSDSWHQVTFDAEFEEAPIVVMGPVSSNEPNPTVVRVRNVTPSGFEFQLDEWDYKDGEHTIETVSYMAIPPGTHQWGGVNVSAGTIESLNHQWKNVTYGSAFDAAPVVLAQQVSNNDGQATTLRLTKVNGTSFDIRLQVVVYVNKTIQLYNFIHI